jgi:hypothetical protein
MRKGRPHRNASQAGIHRVDSFIHAM